MPTQTSPSVEEQKIRREALMEEGRTGVTKRDILPNTEYALRGEAEAMYFKHAREFLRTSLAYRVINATNNVNGGM